MSGIPGSQPWISFALASTHLEMTHNSEMKAFHANFLAIGSKEQLSLAWKEVKPGFLLMYLSVL